MLNQIESIKQTDAIFALEGFKKDDFSTTVDGAVLGGRVSRKQATDEMVAHAKKHNNLDGFLETRNWLK